MIPEMKQNVENSATDKCIQNKVYIFCKNFYKRQTGRIHKLSYATDEKNFITINEFATKCNDFELLNEINIYITHQQSIPYHQCCKSNYNSKAVIDNREKTGWHSNRNHYNYAFHQLCLFVQDYIIKKENCCFIEFIEDLFLEFLLESYKDQSIEKNIYFAVDIYRSGYLKRFIKKLNL